MFADKWKNGGHGGGSEGETSSVLVFASKSFPKSKARKLEEIRRIRQVDFVSTVSCILGVPIPKNNLGTVIEEVLEKCGFNSSEKALSVASNVQQQMQIIQENASLWKNGRPANEKLEKLFSK